MERQTLQDDSIKILALFVCQFSWQVWEHAQVLLIDADFAWREGWDYQTV